MEKVGATAALPEAVPADAEQNEEFLKLLHHILLEVRAWILLGDMGRVDCSCPPDVAAAGSSMTFALLRFCSDPSGRGRARMSRERHKVSLSPCGRPVASTAAAATAPLNEVFSD